MRHVDTGGDIELSGAETESHVIVTVRNTGDAIPEYEVERVFDRLFRGDRARHTPGTGLGLTIARQIIELHGGTIGITSSATTGTTVLLRFPR